MNMLGDYQLAVLAIGSIGFGLVLLVKGGDWTIEASAFVAERLGVSKLLIGATIVAFGTSAPELFTSVNANLTGFPGISLGNVIGSNIANMLLILGAVALVFALRANPRELRTDLLMMGFATLILVGLMMYGVVTQLAGLAMFALLVAFVVFRFRTDKGEQPGDDEAALEDAEIGAKGIGTMPKALLFLALGLAALVIGSELLVQGAVAAGAALGVPEAIIGLTVVAVGTSLPELSTCLAAAVKRQTNMIIGNIIGSNLFNILSIVGITAMIKPLAIDPSLADMEMWLMLGLTALLVVWMLTVARIGRPAGIAMLAAYVVFTAYQYQDVVFG